MTKKLLRQTYRPIAGTLSAPSKMPCCSYNIPAFECKIGAKLAKVKGSTCFNCYALKGRYTFPNVIEAMYKRFKAIYHDLWVEAMVVLIPLDNKGDKNYFRWHDSGDLQDTQHLDRICQIAYRLPDISFWLPTREYAIVNNYTGTIPTNLTIRYSEHMNDKVTKNVKTKPYGSIVVSNIDILPVLQETTNKQIKLCPASKQGNQCVDCRACWHFEGIIAYPEH